MKAIARARYEPPIDDDGPLTDIEQAVVKALAAVLLEEIADAEALARAEGIDVLTAWRRQQAEADANAHSAEAIAAPTRRRAR